MATQTGELREIVGHIDRAIKRLGAPPTRDKVGFLAYQESQVNRLVELEREFRDRVLADGHGEAVYRAFMVHVDTLASIMSSRAYFRERQEAFVDVLGPAFQAQDWTVLARYRINFRFIALALQTGVLGPWFRALAARIERLRSEMILLLMPLAISRARMFWGRTPAGHLSLRDIAQIAFEGLPMAVDKYVPPFSKVYRAVAIGRITGCLIEAFSQTLLHLYPDDRKVLYRANKVASRYRSFDGVDYRALADRLNQDGDREELARAEAGESPSVKPFRTSPEQVADLMAAASTVSADAARAVRATSRLTSPEEDAPDRLAAVHEVLGLVRAALVDMPLVFRKVLALRGMISVEEVVV